MMFDNIIGNEENKKKLKNIIETNAISHSYIFSGISGIGKFLFAKEFAKSILCLATNLKPCNNCKSCESFDNSNNPDIIIIDEQENSIKTEQIKNLTESVLKKPIQSNKKIYIINNSENMTKEAQNSILKTLEEPPQYIVIILITKNENLLLNTIKSRCIDIKFKKLSDIEIERYFKSISENVNSNMLKVFGGSIEKAINIGSKIEIYDKVLNFFSNIEEKNELQLLKAKEEMFTDKEEIYNILDYINTILFDKMYKNIVKVDKYEKSIENVEKTKIRLKKNSNYDMTIDNLLITLWEEIGNNG